VTKSSTRSSLLFSALVLFAVNVLNFYDRHVAGALTEPIRKEFQLNDTQVGLLNSAFIWVYALVGLPLGWLADRVSRKRVLAAAVLVWASLTASAAFAGSFTALLVSRIGVGIGEAGCAPSATSWLGDLFPPQRRSRALAVFMLGVPVGGALSFFFSGSLAQSYGWRAAMVAAAAPALLLIPALLCLREPERGAAESSRDEASAGSAWELLRMPTLWWIIASGALLNFCLYAIATFLPALLSRVHKVSLASSGTDTGIVYLTGGLLGATLAGYLGDAIRRRGVDGRLRIAALTAFLAAPLSCISVLQRSGALPMAMTCMALAYALLCSYYGLVYSSIQDLVAPRKRATAMAIYFLGMYACGASFGPLLTGHLSDVLARRAADLAGIALVTENYRAIGLQQAMLVIPVLSLALAAVLFGASRAMLSDSAIGFARASAEHPPFEHSSLPAGTNGS
jgi:MFS family permease